MRKRFDMFHSRWGWLFDRQRVGLASLASTLLRPRKVAAMTTATRSSNGQQDTGSGASGSPGSNVVSTIARQVAQDLLPQLTTRLLDAAADRGLNTVQRLASRLESVAAHGGTSDGLKAVLTGKSTEPNTSGDQGEDDGEAGEKSSILGKIGTALNIVLQQAIALLEVVKHWISWAIAAAKQRLGRDSGEDDSAEDDAEGDSADYDEHDDAHDQGEGDDAADYERDGDEPARRSANAR